LIYSAQYSPTLFGWAVNETVFDNIIGADVCIFCYLAFYVIWTFYSFLAPKGNMPEILCIFLALCGFFFVFPMYFSLWYNIIYHGSGPIQYLVILSLVSPVVIALAQSSTSALLYAAYLSWFLFLIIFFLVYIPGYSFARLWDTTWG
jgi:hypothetical protein